MYARATSGDKLNNNKFSICSIRNISQVLEKKRNNCFVGMYLVVLIAKWLSCYAWLEIYFSIYFTFLFILLIFVYWKIL